MNLRGALLGALAVGALAAVGFAAPASAAPTTLDPIAISPDGVGFSSSLGGSLFAGAVIVPGGSETRSFWLRNQAGEPGHLAIALQGVHGGNPALLNALTIDVSTPLGSGAPVALSAAAPCLSLLSGVTMASGDVLQVDVRIALGQLNASEAQGSVGEFELMASLTSTDVPAPDGCSPSSGGSGGGTGGGGSTGGSGGASTGGTGSGSGAASPAAGPGDLGTVVVSGADSDDPPRPSQAEGRPLEPAGVEPNTGRFYQEWDIVFWATAFALAGIVTAWRRSRDEEEGAADGN